MSELPGRGLAARPCHRKSRKIFEDYVAFCPRSRTVRVLAEQSRFAVRLVDCQSATLLGDNLKSAPGGNSH